MLCVSADASQTFVEMLGERTGTPNKGAQGRACICRDIQLMVFRSNVWTLPAEKARHRHAASRKMILPVGLAWN